MTRDRTPRAPDARPRWILAIVSALLLAQASLLTWAAFANAPTWDEPAHLAAGLSVLDHGSFGLYRVNGPYPRVLGALVARSAGAETDWSHLSDLPGARPEFSVGADFARANGEQIFRLVSLARLAVIPIVLAGGLVCFLWARALFGDLAGLAALTAWCASPNILGHGALLTGDVTAAVTGIFLGFTTWRWLSGGERTSALAAGLAAGLALLAKATWLLVFPLLPALVALVLLVSKERRSRWKRSLVELIAVLALAVLVLNAGYLFRGSLTPLGHHVFVSNLLAGGEPGPNGRVPPGNRFEGSWLGALPVPLPADWLLGLDTQRRDFQGDRISYLRGEIRPTGLWYFSLYGLLVKLPVGTLLVLLFAVGWTLVAPRERSPGWPAEAVLLGLPFAALGLVSSQTGMTHHVRYVFVVLPFAFVFMSRLFSAASRRSTRSIAGLLILLSLLESMAVWPRAISFFNLAAGGPARGHEHLIDSNVDWGQDLFLLAEWAKAHPEARPLHFAYFGSVDPLLLGIEYRLPPSGHPARTGDPAWVTAPAPGWHAVSASLLHGWRSLVPDGSGRFVPAGDKDFTWLLEHEPVARAGDSILIYRVGAP